MRAAASTSHVARGCGKDQSMYIAQFVYIINPGIVRQQAILATRSVCILRVYMYVDDVKNVNGHKCKCKTCFLSTRIHLHNIIHVYMHDLAVFRILPTLHVH